MVKASATLTVSVGQCSLPGKKPVNQDFHGACVPAASKRLTKGIVAAVADGIGSSAVSHVASQAAVQAVLEDYYLTSEAWSVKRSMQRVLAATNSWLHAQTQRGPYRDDQDRGYVCTLSVLVLKGNTAHLFHAGDTRIHRLQRGSHEQLTEDHRVWVGGGQSYLSRALGFHAELESDYRAVPVECGDVFLLTSDGVHEHLLPADYASTLVTHGDDLDRAARALVEEALARGSGDNLTAQIVRVDELPASDAAEAQRLRAGLRPPALLAPRAVLDGYRVEREIHASHRSHVYLATDLATGTQVALKAPSIEQRDDGATLDRFALEEWIARRIDSPHVLKAHDNGQRRSHLFVAMEYVEGTTLAQWMRDHPRAPLETVRGLVEQIARGLQAFHRLEMVHQDLRPENILIDARGTVKIADFGATRVSGLQELDAQPDHSVLGTLSYTAPERFLGDAATERSDLFALGVIAYQMLTGRLPFGTSVPGIRHRSQLTRLNYDSARRDRLELPRWLDEVLAKAVHPVADKRHEAVSEFTHELRHTPPGYTRRHRLALVERDPVLFWKAVAVALAGALLCLLGWLTLAAPTSQPPAAAHATSRLGVTPSPARSAAPSPAPARPD